MTTTRQLGVTDPLGVELTIAAGAQGALLAALSASVGLGASGWLTGLGYATVLGTLLLGGLRRAGARTLGPANRVTMTRAVLVGGVTALVASMQAPVAAIVAMAAVALALDAVDGLVARRTGTASALGARFDMEIDAFLILVLSVYVAGTLGPWVLAIGAMRYAFVVAGWLLPWLREPLTPNRPRKVVAAVQGVALAVAAAAILPTSSAIALVTVALAALVWSFGRDTVWLWRHRPTTWASSEA